MHSYVRTQAGDLNYLKPLITGPHTHRQVMKPRQDGADVRRSSS